MVPFVGRQSELAILDHRFEAAAAGRPQTVVIQGPPGIGKSSLLEAFLTRTAPAAPVLRASGEEAEQLLNYGVLEQLARSAARRPGARPGPDPTDAVRALTDEIARQREQGIGDAVTTGTRFLEFLDRLSAGAVVVVVDDAHWADRLSLQAVLFALRRLVVDQVLSVLTLRDTDVAGLPDGFRRHLQRPEVTVLRLRGLDEEDLGELAQAMGVQGIDAAAARRLRYGTRGNPLHARAVLEEFSPDEWGAKDQPLPAPLSFRALVQDRLAACSVPTRALVEAAAVLGPRTGLTPAATLAGVGDALTAVDEAAAHGLLRAVESEPGRMVSFPHPLIRSAVYDGIGLARRHGLHLAAARSAPDPATALHHRVLAANGPDAEIAADLAAFAQQLAARHDWQSAAAQLITAGRLSPDPVTARRSVLQAVVWSTLRGDAATARSLAGELDGLRGGPLHDVVAGGLAMAADAPAQAQALFDEAWQADPEGTDAELRSIVALLTAIHFYGRLDAAATVVWCERALALSRQEPIRALAETYLVHGLGYAGRAADSYLAAEAARDRPGQTGDLWLNPRTARGVLRLVDDDLAGARDDLESTASAGTRLSMLNTASFSFAYLARAEWVAGDWDEAVVHAERALAINVESGFEFMESAITGIAVLVPAARGDFATAERLVDTMSHNDNGYERSIVALGMARARVGEARDDPESVVAGLEPVCRFPVRDGIDEPGFWAWQDLYADALVRTGRVTEADAFLVPHERQAALRGRRTSMARLARSRGRVEAAQRRVDAADAAFRYALDVLGDLAVPFERARIEFAAGAVLRRAGQRRRAADLLESARRRFAALDALPYLERCEGELAASGVARGRPGGDRAGLTTQEWVVARHAAQGRSNRQIAAEIVVSVKTVEYHLRNAFTKLDISSRRQLAARLADLG